MTALLPPDAPEAGLSARAVSVTYRNGVTALTNASFLANGIAYGFSVDAVGSERNPHASEWGIC